MAPIGKLSFTATLLTEHIEDHVFRSYLSDPNFGDIALSTLWSMYQFINKKKVSFPVQEDLMAHDRKLLETRIAALEKKVESLVTAET
jgi:hypothetical protein